MYHVRHYTRRIHPDSFRNGTVLGFVIYFLNYLRWKLEVSIQRLVVRFIAKSDVYTEKELRSVLDAFKLDVKREELEKLETSPLNSMPPPDPTVRRDVVRQETKEGGRWPGALQDEDGEPLRNIPPPKSMSDLISRYGFGKKQARYSVGRRRIFTNPDGDFEPLNGAIHEGYETFDVPNTNRRS